MNQINRTACLVRDRLRRVRFDLPPMDGPEIEPVDPEFDEEDIDALLRDIRDAAGTAVDPETG